MHREKKEQLEIVSRARMKLEQQVIELKEENRKEREIGENWKNKAFLGIPEQGMKRKAKRIRNVSTQTQICEVRNKRIQATVETSDCENQTGVETDDSGIDRETQTQEKSDLFEDKELRLKMLELQESLTHDQLTSLTEQVTVMQGQIDRLEKPSGMAIYADIASLTPPLEMQNCNARAIFALPEADARQMLDFAKGGYCKIEATRSSANRNFTLTVDGTSSFQTEVPKALVEVNYKPREAQFFELYPWEIKEEHLGCISFPEPRGFQPWKEVILNLHSGWRLLANE
jgi:hypothetical protein